MEDTRQNMPKEHELKKFVPPEKNPQRQRSNQVKKAQPS